MKKLILPLFALSLAACVDMSEYKPLAGHYELVKGEPACPDNIDMNVGEKTLVFYFYENSGGDDPMPLDYSALLEGEQMVENDGILSTYKHVVWQGNTLLENYRTVATIPGLGEQEVEKGAARSFVWTDDKQGLSYKSQRLKTDEPCEYKKQSKNK